MNATNSVLKILIMHEDLAAGIEAGVVLGRLGTQLEAEFEIASGAWWIDSGYWRFDALRDPELWKLAADEAVEADVIMISTGGAELPPCLTDWLENVLPMKDGRPAALVALLHRNNHDPGGPTRQEACLRRLAGKCGLDFFCNTGAQHPDIASGIESILSRSQGGSTIWESPSPEWPPAESAPMNAS